LGAHSFDRKFIAASSVHPDVSYPQEPAWAADVAAVATAVFPLAAVIQAVDSTEQPVADGRFEAAREHGCSVAQQARDHFSLAAVHDSAPVGLEPPGVAAAVAHDFPPEPVPDDHFAPVAVHDSVPVGSEPAVVAAAVAHDFPAEPVPAGRSAPEAADWAAFLPVDCLARAVPAVAGWVAARSVAAGCSAALMADDRFSLVAHSAVLAEADSPVPAGLRGQVASLRAGSRQDDLKMGSRADLMAHFPAGSRP